MKKVIRVIAKVLLSIIIVIFVLFHLVLLYFGSASVITAILMYFGIFLGVDMILRKTSNSGGGMTNARLMIWALFVGVLLMEVSLRYITKSHLSYVEKNGSFYYACPYSQVKKENLMRRYGMKQEDVGLLVWAPNMTRMSSGEFVYEHSFNSIGIREADIEKEVLDTSLVILGIGDSFTEGAGAPADSSWIKLLAAELRQDRANIIGVNGGMGGSDVFYETYKLKHLLYDTYQPDIVVLAINSSDVNDVVFRGGQERFVSKKKIKWKSGPWWKYLYSFSHISRFVIHSFFDIEWHYYTKEAFTEKEAIAKQEIQDAIENDLLPYSQEKGFSLLVAFLPNKNDLESNEYALGTVYEGLSPLGDFHKLNIYSRLSKLELTDYGAYYWPIDQHNNSSGYLLYALEMADEIRNAGWLSSDEETAGDSVSLKVTSIDSGSEAPH